MGLFSRQQPAYKMSDNPAQFLAALSTRKHWKAMNPEIFRGALAKAGPPAFPTQAAFMEAAKLSVVVAEDWGLLTGNLVKIADESRNEPEQARVLFSMTYYNAGSDMSKAGYTATEIEQLHKLILGADMALMAAILFEPFCLSAYACMAFLYNCEYNQNFPVALDWCDRYIAAEELLRNTPDSELSFFGVGAKHELLNPTIDPSDNPIREMRGELQEKIARGTGETLAP